MIATLPRLLLASSNISAPSLSSAVKHLAHGARRGAIVTTAEIKPQERHRHASLAWATLTATGIPELEFFDLDTRPSEDLGEFDFIYLTGGNSYYLLKRVRETDADTVLERLHEAGVPIVGASAGAVLLGPSIRHMRIFDPNVPDLGWKSTAALNLAPFSVLPHANRWRARFSDYEARLATACTVSGCQIVELNDGEGVSIEDRNVRCVGGDWDESHASAHALELAEFGNPAHAIAAV